MKLAIKSHFIYIDSQSPPFSGYILINGDTIEGVNLPSEVDLEPYEVLDYSDYYVMPGLIDINTHLNAAYHSEWQEIEAMTKQALTGGVTTIIDNPIMNHKDTEDIEEIHNIEIRKKALEGKLSVDVGLLGYLGPHNYTDFAKIYEETGVIGFKLYLSQPFEENIPPVDLRDLTILSQLIKKSKIEDLVLSINCEMASTRDLYMASPCRKTSLENRLNLKYDIHNFSGFGGGHHGVYQQNEEDEEEQFRKKTRSMGQKPTEDSIFDIISEINYLEASGSGIDRISPSTALLNLNSKLMSNILEQKHISDLELMDYEDSYSEKNEPNLMTESTTHFNFQDYDSNLEYSVDSLERIESNMMNTQKQISDVQIDQIRENSDHKQQNTEPDIAEIMLSFSKQPKRFDSCPFFKVTDFFLKNAFEDAFEEIKKKEPEVEEFKKKPSEELIISKSDHSNDSNNSFNRTSLSSFGERRKTFIEKKHGPKTPQSKFRNVALIKTKTPVHQEKEKKKNRAYIYFLPNHPVSWETNGLNIILRLFLETSNEQKVVLTNLSSPCLAFQVREARKLVPNLRIYTDTAAPFAFFNKDEIKLGGTKMKCSPPIRDKENQYFLVRSLKALIFDTVSSYHLGVPERFKAVDEGNFRRAFNGISSIGGTLSMIWTKFYSILRIKQKKHKREFVEPEEIEKIMKKLVYLMSENPSKIMFLDKKKGVLKKGFLADLFIWDPFKIKKIQLNNDKETLLKNKNMYCLNGTKVYGEVVLTMLRGEVVFQRELKSLIFKENRGKLLFNKAWCKK